MTITTWRPRVTEARIKPEPHTWRQAAVIVPLVAGGLYAVVAVAGAARLPWEGVAAAVGLAGFTVVIAAASVTGNGILAGYAAVCGAVACGWVLYAQLTSPWTISVAFALLGPALFLGAGYPVVHGRHRQAIAEANRRADPQGGRGAQVARPARQDRRPRRCPRRQRRDPRRAHLPAAPAGRQRRGHGAQADGNARCQGRAGRAAAALAAS